MYFETHAHYYDNRFKNDFDEVIKMIEKSGVHTVINASADMKSSKQNVKLVEKHELFYCGIGVHPHNADDLVESDVNVLRELSKHKKVIAIGEIGLDFHYNHSPQDIQRYWFKKQLQLANELDLPVIIHSREADQECFDIVKDADIQRKGVIHCFAGSKELAKEYVKLGYKLGIGGVVTYANARKVVETVREVGIESILLETDCPYLTPVPNRGKRNDSSNLKYICEEIANIKNMSHEEVAKVTSNNAVDIFF